MTIVLSVALAMATQVDPSSYANLDEVLTTHIDLDLEVDFLKKSLSGSVELHMRALKRVSRVDLDYLGLVITSVERVAVEGDIRLKHDLSLVYPALGRRLSIQLDSE